MTRYGWDASHYDWNDGDLHLGQAHADGIDLFTYKATEGNGYTDPVLASTMTEARGVGFPVVGNYHFLLRSDRASIASQASHYLAKLDEFVPWRHNHPCFVYQVDAENDSAGRHPSVSDINAFADRIKAAEGCPASAIPVYAPKWLYGEGLTGLRYRTLWASAYVNGAGGFKSLYPGDGSSKWNAYSGITPAILQYSSSAVIAGKTTCDANAIRVSTVAALQAIFWPNGHDTSGGGTEIDMTPEEHDALMALAGTITAAHEVTRSTVRQSVSIAANDVKATVPETTAVAVWEDTTPQDVTGASYPAGQLLANTAYRVAHTIPDLIEANVTQLEDDIAAIVASGGDPTEIAQAVVAKIRDVFDAGVA